MTPPTLTTVSVRGDARRDVDPDSARLDARVRTFEASKAEALRVVGAQTRSVLAGLEALGGAALTAADERRDLGWIADGAVTWEEQRWRNDEQVPTGRIGAVLGLVVTVREFGLVDAVAAVLAEHDLVHLNGVGWAVDEDNPAWARVRADAISAAVAKARDYAAALGGELQHVDHVADAGLLGSGPGGGWMMQSEIAPASIAYKDVGVENGSPPLDPVPQTVRAVIEARFTASVAPLR